MTSPADHGPYGPAGTDPAWVSTTMLEHTRDAVVLTDAELDGTGPHILYANPAFFAMTGHEPDTVIGRSPRLLQTDETDRAELDRVRAALECAEPLRAVLLNQHADGSDLWIELDVTPLRDEDGTVTRFIGILRDVTDRVRNERLAAVGGATHDLLGIVDPDGTVCHVNDAAERLLGRRADELVATPLGELLRPDDAARLQAALRHDDDTGPLVVRARHHDGHWRELDVRVRPRLADPAIRGVVVTARDATVHEPPGRRRLGDGAEQVTRALESVTDGYLAVDTDWRITYLNARGEQLLGYSRDKLIGQVLWEALPDLLGSVFERCYRHAAATGESIVFEAFHPPHGRWYQERVFPGPNGVVAYFHDVTDRVRADAAQQRLLAAERTARRDAESARAELAHAAAHDPLTGLVNRTQLERYLDEVLLAPTSPVALLFLDLDDFKVVNDSLGHAVGDSVLCQISARLVTHCDPGSVVARFGGDEFIVAWADDDAPAAVDLADRLRQHLGEPYETGGRTVTLSASVGVAIAVPGDTADTLIRNADTALSAAKRRGRDELAVFDEGLHHRVVQRLETEHDLRATNHGEQLELYYQPIFALADGRRVGSEALLRWQHPSWGLLTPGSFIDIAEDTGLIVSIGAWVLEQACATIAARRGDHADTVWVNMSAPQLVRPDFAETVAAALSRHGVRSGELGIELTERSLITEPDTVAAHLARLHDLGVAVAVDDFGTGYSSMTALQHYPLDVLKIDRAFVARLDTVDGRAIVAATVQLAHALGATASAEGVETTEQLDALRAVGCDTAAGFLLAAPQPVSRPMPDRLDR